MKKLTHAEIKSDRKTVDSVNEFPRNPIYGLCENIRSIYNVGAIFRSSDAAFISKLYLTGYTPYPPRKEIDKVALGATLTVPWEYYKDPISAINQIKENNIKLCAIELTDKRTTIWDEELNIFPVCLIVGNEVTGVSKEILDLCDYSAEIPMYGMKQSLNVSVAYGIAVYEFLRKLKTKK